MTDSRTDAGDADGPSHPTRRQVLLGGSALGLTAAGVGALVGPAQAVQVVASGPVSTALVPSSSASGGVGTDDLVDIRRQQSAARAVAAKLADATQEATAELTESSAALQGAARRLSGVQAQLETVRTQEASAVAELTAARSRETALQASVARTTRQTAAAQASLDATTAELTRAEATVGGLARAAYRGGWVPPLAEVVTGGPDPGSVLSSAQALGSATRSQQAAAARLAVLRTDQAARRSGLSALGVRLAADRTAAAQIVTRVAELRAQASARTARTAALVQSERRAADAARVARDADVADRTELDAEQARTGALLRSLSGRADAEVARARAARAAARARAAEQARRADLARVRAQQLQAAQAARVRTADRAREVRTRLARRPTVDPTPTPTPTPTRTPAPGPDPGPDPAPVSGPVRSPVPDGGGRLSRPADGPITSGFGRRFHPVLHIWRLHAGTDFGCGCGSPIRAAAAGRVVSAAYSGGFGNRVVVDHGVIDGIPLGSSYNHLSRSVVRTGTRVQRGQLVGLSGQTGLATGCHLHFEVYENGTPVDPMTWLT